MAEFDLNRFKQQIADTRKRDDEGGEGWLQHETEIQRNEGIRAVLETNSRDQGLKLRAGIEELFGPEIKPELNRLFAGSEDQDRLSESTDLACFWLLRVPGLAMLELQQNPFDLAYLLRDRLSLRSSDPDIPYAANFFGGSPPSSLVGSRVLDRAWSLRAMRVPDAWKYSKVTNRNSQGDGIVVGHPDTGYADHVDLDKRRLHPKLGWNFVENNSDPSDPLNYSYGSPGHGTATGSVLLSEGTVRPPPPPNKEGGTGGPGKVTGVAPAATLVPIRTSRKVWWVLSSNLARAIYHARTKSCHVVSISIGGRGFRHLQAALHDAVKANVVVVAAAGNFSPIVVWPARYDACIAMAATNIDDLPWIGSSCGPQVDMSAPGEDVWRAFRASVGQSNTDVGPSSGTSYATANAAGAAALWLAHHGRAQLVAQANGSAITVQDLFRDALQNSARTPPGWNPSMFGAGIIDAYELLMTPIAPGTRPSPSASYANSASLRDLQQGQDLIDLRQAQNLVAPEQPGVADIILSGLLNARIQDLPLVFKKWGAEIVNILFDLGRAEHPLFRRTWTEEKEKAAVAANEFRAAVCARASQSLKEFLKCE